MNGDPNPTYHIIATQRPKTITVSHRSSLAHYIPAALEDEVVARPRRNFHHLMGRRAQLLIGVHSCSNWS
jgi:hypothetical protein